MDLSDVLGPNAPWEVVDCANLRQFLNTVSGRRYLAKMFTQRPRATEKTDPVKRSIQSGVQEGFEEMFAITVSLANPRTADDVRSSGVTAPTPPAV